MTIVALLPMKANSERVKGKNFKDFAGKPLFQWILHSLLEIEMIDQVVINTDASEILLEHGIKENERILIRERKRHLCGDNVSMNLILADDLSAINADTYLMTHTTNPLLSVQTIMDAITTFESSFNQNEKDSLFGVTKHQTRFYTENGRAVNHDPNNLIRTQDLEPWYEENSCIYLFSERSFTATNARIGVNPILFEIPKLESIDIDGPEEWIIAEALAVRQQRNESNA